MDIDFPERLLKGGLALPLKVLYIHHAKQLGGSSNSLTEMIKAFKSGEICARLFYRIPYVVDLRDPWKLAKRALPVRGIKGWLGFAYSGLIRPPNPVTSDH